MNLNSYHNIIIEHAESEPFIEVCGFVVLNKDLSISIHQQKNQSSTPEECFEISPQKWIDFSLKNKILAVYHSHPKSKEKPSCQDIKMSEEMGVPYLIYSLITKNFFLYYPESYTPDSLLGRPYVKGLYECTCLFKDYFIQKMGINITKWNDNYWLTEDDAEANNLLDNILNKNLLKIEKNQIREHDVIVFQIKTNGRKHVGIYLGDDYFMHQCNNTSSRKQLLDTRWQSKIKAVYRHPSLV